MNLENIIVYSKEVQEAKEKNLPIVALESTIISHGMPYPQNVKMAKATESIIRENGAVPATIAIIHGKIKIGLEEEDLELLATAKDVKKVSRRDMAEVLAKNQIGATTVAATMIAAKLAGIKVFVTGGIGGVHRGFEETMDVSADLEELAQSPVAVVCAGAKAILDIPRTLEYLETKGVPVIGYQTDYMPAFYSAQSEYKLVSRDDNVEDLAKRIYYSDLLGLKAGFVVANPVPKEHEIPHEEIDKIINQALIEEKEAGIKGKDSTPFLLAKIVELSGGKSLETNIELVYNNARLGSQLALAYNKLTK
ncbi:MAG: pseudouridine-5'-phosphate glycosidase [Bacillota bacterium]|nr:pseudouridine-5'-phosphate glycosidase [Bacillota bacterium]